jgi:transposase
MDGPVSRSTNRPNSPPDSDPIIASLREEITELNRQLEWFKRQLFGRKSEQFMPPDSSQMSLGEDIMGQRPDVTQRKKQKITYERGVGPKVRPEDCVSDKGLRFSKEVPVKTIRLSAPGLDETEANSLELVTVNQHYRLAQRPASYVVICYEQPVYKHKDTGQMMSVPMVSGVLDKSLADVSFLSGLLVEKFVYHLPLYRQHQRLKNSGIELSRATLTNLVKRSILLLSPIVDAQLSNILRSKVLAIDETPIKVGKSRKKKGRMHQGYYWPMYGNQDEVVFTYSQSRSRQVIEELLKHTYTGTLLSDGYKAYASYVKACESRVCHAQCWSHTRRKFVEAEPSAPQEVEAVLTRIRVLYANEDVICEQALEDEDKRAYRLKHSKPIVDELLQWAQDKMAEKSLLPKDPLTVALSYMLQRSEQLKVFLEDPQVPLDTNHLERALRPIAMGRRNWLFCWSEVGAKQVGIIQSLLSTCKLQGVYPSVYLTDVLQRIAIHPNHQVELLTPRLWKEHFADNPLRSDLELIVNDVVE